MKNLCIGLAALLAICFAQPSYAECGNQNRVEYVRSSQRDSRTDLRLKVEINRRVRTTAPVVDVKTTLLGESGTVAYSFVLSPTLSSPDRPRWAYEERTETGYTRINLYTNSDGTSTLRVAMRVPYTVFNAGLGYYASVRSCR